LTIWHQYEGLYAQARALHERALAIREQVLGEQHPNTATSLNNLAMFYEDEGNYLEAKTLYERAITINKAVLPAEHPHIHITENSYADLLEKIYTPEVDEMLGDVEPEPKPVAKVKEGEKPWWRFW